MSANNQVEVYKNPVAEGYVLREVDVDAEKDDGIHIANIATLEDAIKAANAYALDQGVEYGVRVIL